LKIEAIKDEVFNTLPQRANFKQFSPNLSTIHKPKYMNLMHMNATWRYLNQCLGSSRECTTSFHQ